MRNGTNEAKLSFAIFLGVIGDKYYYILCLPKSFEDVSISTINVDMRRTCMTENKCTLA